MCHNRLACLFGSRRVLDAPVPSTTSSILKLDAIDHGPGFPTVFRGKNGEVALEDVRHIGTQQSLLPRLHGLNKGPHESVVAAAVASAFGGWLMYGLLTGAEVGHGELSHVADDLSVSEVQAGLAVTDQGGEGDHGEREGGA